MQQALVSYEELRTAPPILCCLDASGGLKKAGFASFWKRQIQNMKAGGPF